MCDRWALPKKHHFGQIIMSVRAEVNWADFGALDGGDDAVLCPLKEQQQFFYTV